MPVKRHILKLSPPKRQKHKRTFVKKARGPVDNYRSTRISISHARTNSRFTCTMRTTFTIQGGRHCDGHCAHLLSRIKPLPDRLLRGYLAFQCSKQAIRKGMSTHFLTCEKCVNDRSTSRWICSVIECGVSRSCLKSPRPCPSKQSSSGQTFLRISSV